MRYVGWSITNFLLHDNVCRARYGTCCSIFVSLRCCLSCLSHWTHCQTSFFTVFHMPSLVPGYFSEALNTSGAWKICICNHYLAISQKYAIINWVLIWNAEPNTAGGKNVAAYVWSWLCFCFICLNTCAVMKEFLALLLRHVQLYCNCILPDKAQLNKTKGKHCIAY